MITIGKFFGPAGSSKCAGLAILVLVVLLSGCAAARVTETGVIQAQETPFRKVVLKVDLADPVDTESLETRLISRLETYDLEVVPAESTAAGAGFLKIDEVGRHIETVHYHRRDVRTSLTQMRGKKSADVPVITLSAVFSDAASGEALYQAEYVARGPWHADSASVVASLAGTLVDQLASTGIIVTR